jgi:hypothetical protein
VDSETVPVNGNGVYTTPTGFTLPGGGAATGIYQWDASYSGDPNNNAASDNNDAAEQVTVSAANPTLVTSASSAVTLPTGPPGTVTLSDSALLASGYFPTGSIVFTLTGPGGFSYTQTDPVSGNGDYTASTTLPTSGQVAGTYTWSAAYGGDSNNNAANDQGGIVEQTVVSPASPTLTTTPSPSTVTLGTAPVTLTDSATLSGGYFPTGAITFQLFQGSTQVHTETVAVSGNGPYTTPTGFTLPTTGTAAGGYVWVAVYSGDGSNNSTAESDPAAEQVTVSPASPTLVTTAVPTTVMLPASPVLTDTAVLSGGYFPTGVIIFTLTGPGSFSFTQTNPTSGNGAYTASTTLPTTGTVAGTYTWTAIYEGDANNTGAVDQGGAAEVTVATKASLSLVTIASPNVTLPTGPPGTVTLSDSADLSGGQSPEGSIVFTLSGPGGFSFTQTDTVSGNGAYTAGVTLPTTGAVAGTYTWAARYSGDANNNPAVDQGGVAEVTVATKASLSLVTIASPNVTLPTGPAGTVTLSDSADLLFGYYTTGSIVFTLTGPGGFSFTQADTVQSGTDTYSASTTLPTTGTVAGTYTWTATYGGDANNNPANDQGGITEQTAVRAARPMLVSLASSPPPFRRGTGPLTLTDTATLSGGYFPTGSIVFTLTGPGGFSFMQTDTVSGNGTYTASAPLPTTGTVAGVYTWTAQYIGDANNNAANDQGGVNEQATVPLASPTLVTTASPAVTLGTTVPTLSDSAVLSGGLNPKGDIFFTLTGPGGFSFTRIDPVSGNGTYTASTTLPTTGTVAGTYTWTATYEGDANNAVAIDQGGTAEQTVVSPAGPAISTTPNPSTVTLGGTLQDVADLTGGFDPTGTITFKLYAPGVDPTVGPAAFTETVTVSGDGTYHTTAGFTPNATGTWHWVAAYTGDSNNNPVSGGPLDEPVTIPAQADLVLTKVAEPGQVVMGLPFTYTLTVHDLGPDAATGVVVDDSFPAGVALVGPFIPSQGTFDPAAGVWNVGTLPAGASATLVVGAQVQTLGPITNSATAHADQFDPDLSNHTASAVVTGMRPADLVSKQFFLDSFDPPAPAAPAAFAANLSGGLPGRPATPGLTGSTLPGAAAVNGVAARLLQSAAAPAGLGGSFNASGSGGTPGPAGAPVAGSPEGMQAPGGGTTSGLFGPAFGDTLGGPVDAAGLVARGQPLAGGGSAAEVALDSLTSAWADPQPAAGLYAQFLYRAADPVGAASRADDSGPGAGDDDLAAAFWIADESFDQP